MKTKILFLLALTLALPTAAPMGSPLLCPANTELTVKAVNKLPITRMSQTIELTAKDLAPLGEKDLNKIHVHDSSGKELLCQAVDTDYDDYHKPDMVIFQADFAANQTKTFIVTVGKKHEYAKEDFKAYGRFVRERFDDFAWENDLIAHRTYGKALITWKGEPLTSSSIDIWSKRTSKLVINDWYMVDNYHADMGEGADDYSAGATRGCGGSGIWANDQLYVPSNFIDSRVLANGPIRVMFELVYEPFDVNGTKVTEVLRISLDAGSQLDRFQSFYRSNQPLAVAVGLKKVKDEQKEFNAEHGWLAIWEPMEKNLGMQGVAAIVNPKEFETQAEDKQNNLIVLKAGQEFLFLTGLVSRGTGQARSLRQQPGRSTWPSLAKACFLRLRLAFRLSVLQSLECIGAPERNRHTKATESLFNSPLRIARA